MLRLLPDGLCLLQRRILRRRRSVARSREEIARERREDVPEPDTLGLRLADVARGGAERRVPCALLDLQRVIPSNRKPREPGRAQVVPRHRSARQVARVEIGPREFRRFEQPTESAGAVPIIVPPAAPLLPGACSGAWRSPRTCASRVPESGQTADGQACQWRERWSACPGLVNRRRC